MGVFIGAYEVLQLEAYDYNCYSEVFSFFMSIVDGTKYFDTGIDDAGIGFWLEMAGYSL